MDRQTSIDYLIYQLNSLFTNVQITDHPNHNSTGYTQITFTHDKTLGQIQFFNASFIKMNTNNGLAEIYASVQQVVQELKELTFASNSYRIALS
jgi:hypothetical protein